MKQQMSRWELQLGLTDESLKKKAKELYSISIRILLEYGEFIRFSEQTSARCYYCLDSSGTGQTGKWSPAIYTTKAFADIALQLCS